MKKIIEYYPKFNPLLGGIETYINGIIADSPQYNFKILTNSIPNYDKREFFISNAEIVRISPSDFGITPFINLNINRMILPYRILSDLFRLHKQQIYLKHEKFDLVHLHWPYTQSNIALLTRFWKNSIFYKPIFFNTDKPELLTIHGLLWKLSDDDLIKKVEDKVLSHYKNIICVDKHIYEYVISMAGDVQNVWYIPNSINSDKFKYNKMHQHEKLKLAFIGRLEKSRGIELLMELIKKKPGFIELHIVGGGNKILVERFKKTQNFDEVFFHENLANDQIPDFLQNIDVLFNPVMAEGISRVTMESMSCGRPVIMLDKGDRYPVIHGKTGFLVEDNVKQVIELLQHIHDNFSILERMSIDGRKIIESEFSNKTIIPKICKIYDLLME